MSDTFPNDPGKLNIYFHISENSGVGYYRQYLPAITLREQGLANVMISDFRWGEGDHVEIELPMLTRVLNWADIVVVGRKDQGEFYSQWGALRDFYNMPIVLDTDDNVHHVRPSNPGYSGYHPGSEAMQWNKQGIGKVFDAITVSTKNLVEYYSKYNPKIFHLPNNLDVKGWNSYPKSVFQDGKVRIGFICSASHPEGVFLIKDAIVAILRKYPNTQFLITAMFRDVFKAEADIFDRVIGIPWIKLENWQRDYKALGIDIGLAPLTDNLFNRAKSNLRWMEYSVQGIPSIVSPVEAYSCVRDEVDGLIAYEKEDWYTQIERLVVNPELRAQLGKKAKETIEEEYDISKNVGKWLDVYKGIVTKYHAFFGKKKEFISTKKGLREIGGGRRGAKRN